MQDFWTLENVVFKIGFPGGWSYTDSYTASDFKRDRACLGSFVQGQCRWFGFGFLSECRAIVGADSAIGGARV